MNNDINTCRSFQPVSQCTSLPRDEMKIPSDRLPANARFQSKHSDDASDTTHRLLTVDDLAALVNLSRSSVYRLVETRSIPFHKISGSLRFSSNDVTAFLASCRVGIVNTKNSL